MVYVEYPHEGGNRGTTHGDKKKDRPSSTLNTPTREVPEALLMAIEKDKKLATVYGEYPPEGRHQRHYSWPIKKK